MLSKRLKLLFVIFSILFWPVSLFGQDGVKTNHFLKCFMIWRTKTQIDNINIEAQDKLTEEQLTYIKKVYDKTKSNFVKFSGAKYCKEEQINLRILSFALMNSNECFTKDNLKDGLIYYGRYFSGSHHLYITPSAFEFEDDLTHEFVHYWQSMCGLNVNEDGINSYFEYIKRSK